MSKNSMESVNDLVEEMLDDSLFTLLKSFNPKLYV